MKKEYSTKPYSFWLNQRMITARWFGEKIGKMVLLDKLSAQENS